MADEWYFLKDGKKIGPLTGADLKRLAQNGKLLATDLVWKTGMAEWKPGSSVTGLFPSVPQPPIGEEESGKSNPSIAQAGATIAQAGATVAQAGQKLFSRVGSFAEMVGNVAGEAVTYDQGLPTGGQDPAIFLKEMYFGGRRNIGTSLLQLKTLGGMVLAAIFSFPYIFFVLFFSLSSWQFLPFTKPELVRITLKQKLRWDKLLPIIIGWQVTLFIGAILCIPLYIFGNLGALLCIAGFSFFLVGANIIAAKKVSVLVNYTRSCIIVDYGFPNKTRLLIGVSDADVEKQMDGVLALCDAIAKANFAPWDSLSNNRNFGIRTYIASLARKITG